MTRERLQLGRADVREETTLAMVLSFHLILNIFSQSRPRLDNCNLESKSCEVP